MVGVLLRVNHGGTEGTEKKRKREERREKREERRDFNRLRGWGGR
jgi:hypothetical protein